MTAVSDRIPVLMPKLGLTMEEGTIVAWLVEIGSKVEEGQILLEIETEKVTAEVVAPVSGVLVEILSKVDETVRVSEPLAMLEADAPAHKLSEPSGHQGQGRSLGQQRQRAPGQGSRATPLAARVAAEHGLDLGMVQQGEGTKIRRADVERTLKTREMAAAADDKRHWVPATPLARRLAAEQGIDLRNMHGTGPEGLIIEQDLRVMIRELVQAEMGTQPQPPALKERIPLGGRRRTIARRMSRSAAEIPHIWLSADINMRNAAARRGAASFTSYVAWVTAQTLLDHPLLNGWLEQDEILTFSTVNLGIAVNTEEGLIVPVVHDAVTLSLAKMDAAIRELAARARENRLTVDDVSGATFTLSNLGMMGVDRFEALINPPQTAIMAIGQVANRPWAVDELSLTVAPVMTVTVAADHRAADGATVARFLHDLQLRLS